MTSSDLLSANPEQILGAPIITITPPDADSEGAFSGTTAADFIQVDPNIEPFNFNLSGLAGGDTLFGGAGDDSISGNENRDFINGLNGIDFLFGNSGADQINGGAANDEAYGGQGNDTLFGDLGDDILSGDKGSDFLIGGPGNDRFIIGDQGLLNAALIEDFVPGADQILVTGVDSFAELDFLTVSGLSVQNLFPTVTTFSVVGVVISVRSSGQVVGVLNNVSSEQISISDFSFLPPNPATVDTSPDASGEMVMI
ncbi:MAG: calcium-binding protein [Microcoleaceae cyanobacterium]